MRTSDRWLPLMVLMIVVGGCGFGVVSPEPPTHDGRTWHMPEEFAQRRRGFAMKEYVTLYLPEARHASRDDHRWYREVPRMVVNLLPDGNLKFKGMTFPLATGTPKEHAASLIALRDELQTLTANPDWRDPEGRSTVWLMFHADRMVPWRYIPELVRENLGPHVRIHRHQWAVRRLVSWEDALQMGTIEAIPEGASAADAQPMRLEGRETSGGPEVTLGVGRRQWFLGVGPPDYRDAEFLGRANDIWAEAQATLAGSRERFDRASLMLPEPSPGVTWGHVVTALDTLQGQGYRIIDLPVQGWRLTMEAPNDPPHPRRDDPLVTPLSVAAVVLGLVLGVFVTLWPLRSRARRRAVPSRS